MSGYKPHTSQPDFTVRFWRQDIRGGGHRWKAEAKSTLAGVKPTAIGFGATPEQALAASCAPLASWRE